MFALCPIKCNQITHLWGKDLHLENSSAVSFPAEGRWCLHAAPSHTLPPVQWSRKKIVPSWNCSQRALQIILINRVMISGEKIRPGTHKCHLVIFSSFSGCSVPRSSAAEDGWQHLNLWEHKLSAGTAITNEHAENNRTSLCDSVYN